MSGSPEWMPTAESGQPVVGHRLSENQS